eukprot:3236645-Lingulodinium_polyedra.AAC.1
MCQSNGQSFKRAWTRNFSHNSPMDTLSLRRRGRGMSQRGCNDDDDDGDDDDNDDDDDDDGDDDDDDVCAPAPV